jgi:hypothetical protein
VYLHEGIVALEMSTSLVSHFWQKKTSDTLRRMAEEARITGACAGREVPETNQSLSKSERRASIFARFRTVADLASNTDQSYRECVRALEQLQLDLARCVPVMESRAVGALPLPVRNPLPSADRSRVRKPNQGAPAKSAKKAGRKRAQLQGPEAGGAPSSGS